MDNKWTNQHTMLQSTLAQLCYEPKSIKSIIDQTGMNSSNITLVDNPNDIWHDIIIKADAQDLLIRLIDNALVQFPASRELKESRDFFSALGFSIIPAEQDAVESINLPRIQRNGGYQIDEPPEDWDVEECTGFEIIRRKLGADIVEDAVDTLIDEDRLKEADCIMVSSKQRLKLRCDPGISMMNGRTTLIIVPEEQPIAALAIIPVERNSNPPTFLRQSLEHVFMTQIAQLLPVSNLRTSYASMTRNTNRLRLTAEFDQKLENYVVNGIPCQSLINNITIIGIQGYFRDYFLNLSYTSQATWNQEEIAKQVALLHVLVDSFRMIKPRKMEEIESEEHKTEALGDKRYDNWIKNQAAAQLLFQTKSILSLWKQLDWEKEESKKRVIDDIQLIRKAKRNFEVQNEYINELIKSLNVNIFRKAGLSELKEFINSKEFATIIT